LVRCNATPLNTLQSSTARCITGKLTPELIDADIAFYTQRHVQHISYTYLITNVDGSVGLGMATLSRPDLGVNGTTPPPRKPDRQWPGASRSIGAPS
jgi:hypothetical protein